MNKKVKNKLNNNGSTIIIVLIAMAFIGILGSLILSISLTNFQVKSVDRKAKENFYSAEIVLDEIKAGLDEQVSVQLEKAYKDVLQQYADLPIGDRNEKFKELFINNLEASLWVGASAPDNGKYNINTIHSFLETATTGVEITSTLADNNLLEVRYVAGIPEEQYIQIKNLHVKYTDVSNFMTDITTDIKITAPAIQVESIGSKASYCDYALISDNTIAVDNPVINYSVEGSVYAAEKILAKSSGTSLVLNSPNVVTRKLIEIADGAKLTIGQDAKPAKIWAKNILTTGVMSDGAEVTLYGDTYMADDLSLNAKQSKVSIIGGYYGYGYGTAANTSSSILINRSNCTLNLSRLDKLFLGGRAFISHDNASGKVEVPTGESISTKTNQNAYLVPGGSIRKADGTAVGHNPLLPGELTSLLNSINPELSVNMDFPSYNGKLLRDFASGCKVIYDSEGLVYFYLEFTDANVDDTDFHENKANEYYKAFYEENTENIESHLVDFETQIIKDTAATPFSRLTNAGNIVLMNSTNSQLLNSSVTEFLPLTFEKEAKSIETQYTAMQEKLMLSTTLSPAVDSTSLFNSIINVSGTNGLVNLIERHGGLGASKYTFTSLNNEGDIIGKIILVNNTASEYLIDEVPSVPTIVVSMGDVKLQCTNYNGLVIAKGNINITAPGVASMTAPDSNLTYEIISHSSAVTVFMEYQNFAVPLAGAGGAAADQIGISDLVSYVNWTKN